ncbi:crotonase/enoyl-CoA hydratase family protein [Nostocoides vanveenii]|uniref:Crotonase/enoyl-CoA hydratase family protein n=1 Tax=Nostocoides vanveenii TaxID=330835 RepID=A0ABP4WEG0_9MICO
MPGVSAETSSVETGPTPTAPATPGGAPGAPVLTCEIADRVAYVRLNRPDKRNALSTELLHELQHTAHRLAKDRTLRAVVLAGTGKAFCAGIDLSVLADAKGSFVKGFLPRPWRGTNLFQEACWAWRRIPVPVIAVVHGTCFGAGIQLALAADFRFTTPDAQWSVMESKWGLVPDMSGVHALSQLIPIDIAKRLSMTGEIISGERAAQLGLATAVASDPHTAAGELLDAILVRSPDSVAASKRIFDDTWHAGARRTFARERAEQARLLFARNTAIARKVATGAAKPDYAPRPR